MKTWPARTHYRLASIPILVAVGLSSAAAEEGKNDKSVDIAALTKSVTLDPKLARCTISKERKGDGLQGLMKALKDGKPPVVARAIHRWKQKRISGETRRTPKFVFGSKTGSDKEAKLAIMSDEYDSLAWGPTFDKTGGKKLYEKLGKSVDCKCDTPLDGELDPMLTGLRQALKVTGKPELISWGDKFTSHDLAAVAQHVIATQEPQEGEISEGVKLEVGLQTYSTRQLFGYMHPVYDPEANALSCEKLEDSVPLSTEFQLYVAITGLEEADEAELAEAYEGDEPQDQLAQGDADLADEEYLDSGETAAEEQEVAALQPNDSGFVNDSDYDTVTADAGDQDYRETDEELREADDDSLLEETEEDEYAEDGEFDEPASATDKSGVSSSRRGGYKDLRDDYVEEPVRTIRRAPVRVVEDIEDDVDDWYDYPGYYDDYDVITVYREPPPPVIIVRPAYVTPVVAILGGAIVFAAVTRPRWYGRPWWWYRHRPWARNNVVVNVNFFRPYRARGFRPGWGLRQNRGFVRRKPRNFARRGNRIIRARANLGQRRGLKGRPGFWKAKRRNARANALRKARRNQSVAARKAIARKRANARRAGGKKNALARRKAALRKAGRNKAAARKRVAARKNAAAKNALARKRAKNAKQAAARKKAAARRTAARKNNANKKRVASRKAAARRNNAAKKRKAAARRNAAQKRNATARRNASQKRKAAARRNNANKRKAAARRNSAQRRKSAARRNSAKRRNNAKRRNAAVRRKATNRRRAAARRGGAQRRNAAARRNNVRKRSAVRRNAGQRRRAGKKGKARRR